MSKGNTIETTRLGRTGLTVSRICFGTAPVGSMPEVYGHDTSVEEAKATVRAILDGPSNFLDTSRNYGAGRSEERIGMVIRERGGLPDGFVLGTKLDRDPETDRFSASAMRRSFEQSLAALGVDRVGLLHLHDPEYAADIEEVTRPGGGLSELYKIREEGLCDAVGLAAGRVDVMMPILERFDFDAIITHNRFMLVNRNAEAMIDHAHGKGIAVLNAAPFAGGVFAKGSAANPRIVYQEAGDAALAPVRAVEEVVARYDVPLGAVALQFSMRDPRITSTICGVGKPDEIAGIAAWANVPVPDALWEELAALPVSRDDPEATRNYVAPS
ncbi:aldo/keto reductase [Bauldia sp.]|uniref:aldo/keto reductase n=1 Tax=Bauldia sp. TaxID=2575872 RepID=UPI0025BB8F21|nr:aldo/keto reductase [Bauldia sp.]